MPNPQPDQKNAATAAPAPAPGPSPLDALEGEARSVEAHGAPVAPGLPGSAAPPGPTAADELHSALVMARAMIGPAMSWWPDFGAVWSDQTMRGIANAGAMVMERHGLTVGQLLGQWGPYLALVGAVAPPSFVTYQVIQQRRSEQQRRPHAPPSPPSAANDARAGDGSAG